jgi:hypothetical protein
MSAAVTTLPSRAAAAPQPFRSAQAAWFWCMGIIQARRDGAGATFGHQRRICEPDDIVQALDRLYRQRRIELAHVRILRIWGERGQAPDEAVPAERGDARLWREAMRHLDHALRGRGIVA